MTEHLFTSHLSLNKFLRVSGNYIRLLVLNVLTTGGFKSPYSYKVFFHRDIFLFY